jgi:hypothetical protein
LQRKIIHSKTGAERAKMGLQMIEETRLMVRNSIRLANPNISEREITAKLFERYYGHEFSSEQKVVIIKGIMESKSNNLTST